MSNTVYCDVCGKSGKRRTERLTPDGWFFAQVRAPLIIITIVCSKECMVRFWKKGPGILNPVTGEVTES